MEDQKPWYASKGVWGGIVAALAGVATMAGVELTGEDQTAVVEVILAAVSAVGGALAIYGRVVARSKVTAK